MYVLPWRHRFARRSCQYKLDSRLPTFNLERALMVVVAVVVVMMMMVMRCLSQSKVSRGWGGSFEEKVSLKEHHRPISGLECVLKIDSGYSTIRAFARRVELEVELANLCGKSFCCLFDGVGSFGNCCNGVFSLLAGLYDDWCIHGCIKTMTSSNNQYLGLSKYYKYDGILVRFFFKKYIYIYFFGVCGLGLVASKHVLVTICAIPLAFDNVGMSVCALSKQTNKQTNKGGWGLLAFVFAVTLVPRSATLG